MPNSPIRHIIAVASGKGGVGKSTVSANLALAMATQGKKIGLMDADVYGPSIPTILGITEKPLSADGRILPVQKHGLKVISMGFFMPANEAVIWRGPMLNKMVQDFLSVVDWGELDALIVDLPPGTGDIQLSLCQSTQVTGAVIVSTPQDVAWNVAQKAIVMFDKLNVPVLGVIENMSYFVCDNCDKKHEIFGHGGAKKAAQILEIPFLGEIPLEKKLRENSDAGKAEVPAILQTIAKNLGERLQHPPKSALGIKKIGAPGQSEVLVEWTDGALSIFSAKELRAACPCAACVDEFTGKRKISPDHIPTNITALSLQPVGRYALHISWSDSHNTGLYGYKYLKDLPIKK